MIAQLPRQPVHRIEPMMVVPRSYFSKKAVKCSLGEDVKGKMIWIDCHTIILFKKLAEGSEKGCQEGDQEQIEAKKKF